MNGNELLGTKYVPEGLSYIAQVAKRATAYHTLTPYPWFGFSDWKTEDRGTLPKCLPFTRAIVKRGARWLFGRELDLVVSNASLSELLNEEWRIRKMPSKLVILAENAAQEGSYCIKFSIDQETKGIKFSVLSQINNVRVYLDPQDQERMLMARIIIPYYDATDGKYYLYREEWTEDYYVKYHPLQIQYAQDPTYSFGQVMYIAGTNMLPEDGRVSWSVKSRVDNPYGVIPLVVIQNIDKNTQWGMGDLWTLEPIIDRVNLTYHLMDKSNQFDSTPTPIFIDAVLEDDVTNKSISPGDIQSIKTDDVEGSGLQAKFGLLEASGKLRPYMGDYAESLMKMVYDAAGSIKIDPTDVSNKGNLTQSVLAQLYGPLIDTTDEKRRNYGTYGIVPLIQKLIYAMNKTGLWKGKVSIPKDPDVAISWPDYFPLSDAEIQQRLTRLIAQEQAGLTTKDRVIRAMANADGIDDVDALLEELSNYKSQIETQEDKTPTTPSPQAKQLAKPKQGDITK